MNHAIAALTLLLVCAPAGAQLAFKPPLTLETPGAVADIVLADFNGDGRLDVALLEGRFAVNDAPAFVQVLINAGGGTFEPIRTTGVGTFFGLESFVEELAAGDFDGDGDLDLAFLGTIAPLTLLFNDGQGHFGASVVTSHTSDTGQLNALLGAGDLDGDGDADIVLGQPMRILFSNPGGVLTPMDLSSGSSDQQVAVVDLTGDGALDIAAGGRVFVNTGGGFAAGGAFLAAGALECAYRDFNGDGRTDVACARFVPSDVRVGLNLGGGALPTRAETRATSRCKSTRATLTATAWWTWRCGTSGRSRSWWGGATARSARRTCARRRSGRRSRLETSAETGSMTW